MNLKHANADIYKNQVDQYRGRAGSSKSHAKSAYQLDNRSFHEPVPKSRSSNTINRSQNFSQRFVFSDK